MKTVITYGAFDLFHEGHENLLRRAKSLGDRLIVGVLTDQYAYERGKYTMVDPVETRVENVRRCPAVDQVIIEDHYGQKAEDIAKYRADIFAIGDDWLGKFDYLKEYCEVVYLPRTKGISSTMLRGIGYHPLRIGIIGCGRIAERFLKETGYVQDVQPAGFYHPDPDRSESVRVFREKHPEIKLSRTAEKLFDQADAVYIASPHGSHASYAEEALKAGCHVLCEKPLAFRGEEAAALFRLAEDRGLVLMEGIKTAYCPGFLRLLSVCRSGIIGEIRDVDATFTKLTGRGTREWTDRDWSGSFFELGCYGALAAVKLLGGNDLQWTFCSQWENGTDAFTRAAAYDGSRSASIRTGIGVKSKGELVISGTAGFITVKAPWWKTTEFTVGFEDPHEIKRFCFEYAGEGLRYEIADFLCRIRGDSSRAYKLTPEDSIRIAEIYEIFQKYREENRRG